MYHVYGKIEIYRIFHRYVRLISLDDVKRDVK